MVLKENTFSSKGNEKKYQQMLKDIWVIDGIDFTKGFKDGKVPDFNNDSELRFFCSAHALNYQASKRSISHRVEGYLNIIKSKISKKDPSSDPKIEVKDPEYKKGPGFSDVLTRSDIIDFRKPFLKDFLRKLEEVEASKGNVTINTSNSVIENNVPKQDRVATDVVSGGSIVDKTEALRNKLNETTHPKVKSAALNMAMMRQNGGR